MSAFPPKQCGVTTIDIALTLPGPADTAKPSLLFLFIFEMSFYIAPTFLELAYVDQAGFELPESHLPLSCTTMPSRLAVFFLF